jgi:hypothetical protein
MTYDKEVVVSDRLAPPSRSSEYELQLSSSLSAVTERLKAGGRIIVTFNNLSSSSWSAMLHPLQMLGFRIERVDLHEPAVKSSKAQFAPDTSYIGDFYIVLRRMEVPLHQTGRSTIEEAIRRLFTLRSGQLVAINRVRAVAIHALLVRNVAAAEFSCIDSVIDALCDVTHAMVSLRDEQPASSSVFTDYLIGLVAAAHSNILTSTLSTETLMAQILQLDAGHTLPTEPELLDSIALYESPRLYLSPA